MTARAGDKKEIRQKLPMWTFPTYVTLLAPNTHTGAGKCVVFS